MSKDIFIYFALTTILIGCMGFLGLNQLNNISNELTKSNDALNSVKNNLDYVSKDTSFLMFYAGNEMNIKSDGKVYSKESVGSINGLHSNNNYIYLNTRNRSVYSVCWTWLHELGHMVCEPDESEVCANEFREKNLFRCEMLEGLE